MNHSILLSKLYNYGIRGSLYHWLKSYLSERKQFTCVNGKNSKMGEINCGVPQGSTLGPLLFLVYINDIINADPQMNIKLFADDTNLFVFGQIPDDVVLKTNDYLKKLYDWLLSNKLSLNVEKTSYTVFSNKKGDINNVIINFNDTPINRVDCCKYLGVYLDENLNWERHISHVFNKLKCFVGIFYKIRNKVPHDILRYMYFAFIHPHILYGIEIYANTTATKLDPLIKLNNKILRILQFKTLLTRNDDLYKKYNSLSIPVLFQFQCLNFIHKIKYFPSLMPPVFKKYVVENCNIHCHDTRSCTDLHRFQNNFNVGHKSLKVKGAQLWNTLPQHLKERSTINKFKKELRFYLINFSG